MQRLILAVVLMTGCTPAPSTLTEVDADVFSKSCAFSSCHGASNGSGDLDLRPGHAYGAMVNVPSSKKADATLVIPGDPDNSYLILKLEGDPSIEGDSMPSKTPPIDQDRIDEVRSWIADGAQDN